MRALQNKTWWGPRRFRLHHFNGFLFLQDGQGLALPLKGEMSCCGSWLHRSCCSFALEPALLHFLVRGLGRRRTVVSVAAGPSRSVRPPVPLCLHVHLPISLCRGCLHVHLPRRMWRRRRLIVRKPPGYRGHRLRFARGSVFRCVVRPLGCVSAFCCCSWRRAAWPRLRLKHGSVLGRVV